MRIHRAPIHLIAIWVLLAIPRISHADTPATTSLLSDTPLPGTYGEAIRDAQNYFEQGRFGQALDLYQHAFRLKATAKAALGELRAAEQLGEYVHARQLVETIRQRFRRTLTPQDKDTLHESEKRLSTRTARLHFTLDPASATVTLNGEPWNSSQQFLLPGTYVYYVAATDHQPVEGQVNVVAGEQRTLTLKLEPTTNRGDADSRLLDAALPPQRVEYTAEGGLMWTWVAAGATVVFAGSTILFYLLADAELDDLTSGCAADACNTAEAQRRLSASPGETFETLTNVSLGLTIAGAVTTAILAVVEWPSDATPEASPQLELAPTGIRFHGHF